MKCMDSCVLYIQSNWFTWCLGMAVVVVVVVVAVVMVVVVMGNQGFIILVHSKEYIKTHSNKHSNAHTSTS